MPKIGFLLFLFVLAQSCQSDIAYTEYQNIEKAEWEQDTSVVFEIALEDSIQAYDVFINIRNTKDYGFSNLFLITQMTFPDQTRLIDTLEYEMADPTGRFLGSGFSDIKENKLFYKENVKFNQKGFYLLEVRQAMRNRNEISGLNPLKGISDVGISIEKVK